MKLTKKWMVLSLSGLLMGGMLSGCSQNTDNGKTVIEIVSYKPEAINTFDKIVDKFNETHDDIELKIESPNEAVTILKTRFIREDYPDIIAIGGDINYTNFLDAGLFANIEDAECISEVKQAYLDIDKNLELVPKEGVYALPYAANAAGVLYNKKMFDEHGWKIPETWDEFITLCKTIQDAGITPLYFGYKDAWNTLAPWNALAVGLVDADLAAQVNRGETNFSKEYRETAEKLKELLPYGEPNPVAYSYNDAATAFANGQSAMWPIGSYAISQVRSVNPDMDIDSFVMPVGDSKEDNTLNSGIDLQFCVMEACPNKEAAIEVLNFLYTDEIIEMYMAEQGGVVTKEGKFALQAELEGMREYIEKGKAADYQDHYYPSEMSVDSMLQTYLLDNSDDALDKFLKRFDEDWVRYNRDNIRKVQEYESKGGKS